MTSDDQLDLFGPAQPEPGRGPVGPAESDEETRRLGEALPRGLHLGTSSWSFPGWTGLVFDRPASEKVLARHGLWAYARHPLFRGVGIDRTWYSPVPAATFAGWTAMVEGGFRFLVKAHEECAAPRFPDHPRYGRRRGDRNPRFLDPQWATDAVVKPFVEGLGEHAGPLLFQLMPLSADAWGEPNRFAERLHRFLESLPRGPTYAVELRRAELITPTYREALEDLGAVHCYNAWANMPEVSAQAAELPPETHSMLVARWMLPRGTSYQAGRESFAPFDRLVRPDDGRRDELVDLIRGGVARGQPVHVIVNNKAEGCAPLSVRRLARALVDEETVPAD